jgi:hypothetical protein
MIHAARIRGSVALLRRPGLALAYAIDIIRAIAFLKSLVEYTTGMDLSNLGSIKQICLRTTIASAVMDQTWLL